MTVRTALPADNEALLELTRATPMPGFISLRIDREPDFFRLVDLRGQGTVIVAEEGDRIVGCLSLSAHESIVAGAPQPLWYVGDLKVHPEFRGRGVGVALGNAAQEVLAGHGADLLFCVASAGNRRVLTFLEGRFNFPHFRSVGRFQVGQFLAFRYRIEGDYTVSHASHGETGAIAELYHRHVSARHLAPVLDETDWHAAVSGHDAWESVLVARRGNTLAAAAVLFDPAPFKQHVVIGIPRHLQILTAPLRPLGRFSPAFRLPRPPETTPMLYLRHLCVAEGHASAARALVKAACRECHSRGYPFAVYGPHERDPVHAALGRLPHFTMGSDGYLTSLKGNTQAVDQVAAGVPIEDYALV